MNSQQRITIVAAGDGERLDKTIVASIGDRLSRSQIQALIANGHILVDGAPARSGWRLKGGETIVIELPPAPERPPEPIIAAEPIALTVIYDDDDIAVIDKPAGLVVHPGVQQETGTLVHALLARFPQIAEIDYAPQRRGIVHRLDKDTSGLIVIAKHAQAMRRLMRQFADRTVEKEYIALTERPPRTLTGRIDAPIARDPLNRKKMVVTRDGRPAVTEFRVIERFKDGRSLIRLKLLTGRTHQARVHMAFLNCPLVGDLVYGFKRQQLGLRRQFLHAAYLSFNQPLTGERLTFESALPDDLNRVLATLRRSSIS